MPHKDQGVKRAREIQRRKKLIRDAKNLPCTDCGVGYPYYVMQLDHRDAGTKLHTFDWYVNRKGTIGELIAEISRCDPVCANCHAERSAQRAGYSVNGH